LNVITDDDDDDVNEDNMEEENLRPSSNPDGDDQDDSLLSMYDPRIWDNLDNSKQDILIERGHFFNVAQGHQNT
jgi:hypothetical protein